MYAATSLGRKLEARGAARQARGAARQGRHGGLHGHTGFECPEAGCTFKDPTSAAVWAHAAEAHGIEEDKRRCLWVGCGGHFAKR